MKIDFNGLFAATAVIMCLCCATIVVLDDGLNAAEFGDPDGPEGSMYNPYVVTSSMISSDAGSIFEACTADTIIIGDYMDVYFKFLPGARVDIYAFEDSDYSLYCTNPGTLSYDDMNPGYNGMVYGTATEDFEIFIYGPEEYLVLHFTADANIVLFTSADTLLAVSNDDIAYKATTNSSATFSEIGGTAASWLEIDPETGQLSGTLPEVDSTTSFTYEIKAVSTQDPDNSATLVLTITVNPALRFISDPAVDGKLIYTDDAGGAATE